MFRSIGKQSGESVESVRKKKTLHTRTVNNTVLHCITCYVIWNPCFESGNLGIAEE